ncbi:MAG: phosphoribosylamine--glycine ligase [bacterium]|nr:phosphoribosylamine--glycine ligase [bacterium]
MSKKILVIGNGGREHAICWFLSQSPQKPELLCAPGNGGISKVAKCFAVEPEDIQGLIKLAKSEKVDLVVVGPEKPLAMGLVNEFQKANIATFGPTKEAATIESSKRYSKELMLKHNIPTAQAVVVRSFNEAIDQLSEKFPIVLKADGLAAGKGVSICRNFEEAEAVLRDWFTDKKGKAEYEQILIEQYLEGEELSLFVVTDGLSYQVLPPVQDHKRLLENDLGFNTGGMGAVAPTPLLTDELLDEIVVQIIEPTLKALQSEGKPFQGILFLGLIISNGKPYVLEYNARFGDPEAQALLPLIQVDLVELFDACTQQKLSELQKKYHWQPHRWQTLAKKGYSLCVVLANRGYPGNYVKGSEITLPPLDLDVFLFHANTIWDEKSKKLTASGGRVLNVVGIGNELLETRDRVYRTAKAIQFKGKQYRQDIGKKVFYHIESEESLRFGATLTILGSSSGNPSPNRNTSSYWLDVDGEGYLLDCGEGTSRSILQNNIDALKLRAIFITHTHPDHCAGLPMLLQMLHLSERHDNLPIYLPSDKIPVIALMLQHMYLIPGRLSFQYLFKPLGDEPYEDERIQVLPFRTNHLEKYREYAEPLGIVCKSYGLQVRISDRMLLYPSDIPSLLDVPNVLDEIDLLLIESTHIHPNQVAKIAREHKIPRVILTHVGTNREEQVPEWRALGITHQIPWFEVAYDGMEVTF